MIGMDQLTGALDVKGTLSSLQNGLKGKIGQEVSAQLGKLQQARSMMNAQLDKVNQAKNLINKGLSVAGGMSGMGGMSSLGGLGGLSGLGSLGGLVGLSSLGGLSDASGLGDLLPDDVSNILNVASSAHNDDTMMCLGDFVFKLSTIPYQGLSKTRSWRHPESSRVGAAPISQFAGPENQKIKLDCLLCPELTGGKATVDVLIMMAEAGEAYPLVDGLYNYIGHFVIENIVENHRSFLPNGLSREFDLTIELKQIPEDNAE